MLKKSIILGVGVVVFLLGFVNIYNLHYVEPGKIGIRVNLTSNKGVQDITTNTGWYFYNQWTERVYDYPTYVQRCVFGDNNDEISFQSKEGIVISCKLAVHYQIKPERAPHVFVNLRGDESQVKEYIRSMSRSVLSQAGEKRTINEIYGDGKAQMLSEAKVALEQLLVGDINIELFAFSDALSFPPNVVESINMTIEAQQRAIAAKNKVEESKALADQQIEAARGRAESVLLEAQKQAEANEIIVKSITPELVKYKAIEKWNGEMPKVTSGNTLISVPLE